MDIIELKKIIQENGIAGAGGAGFPTYAKLDMRTDTIILNCAECEPLLKVHRQMLQKFAYEIMTALSVIAQAVEAQKVVIAVKGSYTGAVNAVKANIDNFKNIELKLLPEIYPAGDEVILIYETLGKVVPPGSIPIETGTAVMNVETVYNVYKALNQKEPVIYKYITVAGEVNKPVTLKAPLGITVQELVDKAGGATVKNAVYIMGGPMTGRIVQPYDIITKTSNAILVMPENHCIVNKRTSKITIDMKRAMSVCCQCQMCTDLCPRHLLGHPIAPHAFMRVATSGITSDVKPFLDTMFCSQCGLCEFYSCSQGLSPRTLIGEYKAGLRKNGVAIPKGIPLKPVDSMRETRRVPMERLTSRLGLTKYSVEAPLIDEVVETPLVKIMLSQHIGAPAKAVVSKGDKVEAGQLIGEAAQNALSIPVHASVSGTVQDVNDKFITIKA